MIIPYFPNQPLLQQVKELWIYFTELGIDLPDFIETISQDQFCKLIECCPVLLKQDISEADLEALLNSIATIILLLIAEATLQSEILEKLVLKFCDILQEASSDIKVVVCLRVLWLLFQGLSNTSLLRYYVYCTAIRLSAHTDQINLIFKDVSSVKQHLTGCPYTTEQFQKLLRLLHEGLLVAQKTQLAAQVMLELLRTYTAENAMQAREDARQCILACLADRHTFLFDHLLSLKPVTFLEGELIHDLLTIFVSEQLDSYLKFQKNHNDFLVQVGLNNQQCIHKMRLLTLTSLASKQSEILFSKIEEKLQISPEEVEQIVIEAIQANLINGRMDQKAKKLFISNCAQRTFGHAQWQQLHDMLSTWRGNLRKVQQSLQQVADSASKS